MPVWCSSRLVLIQQEMIANLTPCKIPTMSSPLLINMRGFYDPNLSRNGQMNLLMPEILPELLQTYPYDIRRQKPSAFVKAGPNGAWTSKRFPVMVS
jgi:hypothetical protein